MRLCNVSGLLASQGDVIIQIMGAARVIQIISNQKGIVKPNVKNINMINQNKIIFLYIFQRKVF